MNFVPDIIERMNFYNRKLDNSYQETEDLLDILKTRSNLEMLYAKDLRNLGARLNKYADNKQNSLSEAYSALRSFFSIHSDLSINFSNQISSDVLDNLNKYLTSSKESLKSYNFLSKNNEKELKRLQDTQFKAKQKYVRHMMKTDTVVKENARSTLKTEDAMKRKMENLSIAENYMQLQEQNYKEIIEEYNTFLDEYFINNAKISEFFTNDQLTMKQTIKDSILKIVVYEISIIRGMQYDLEKISKKIEIYNPNSEKFELFYEDSQNNFKPFLKKINFESWKQNFEDTNFVNVKEKKQFQKEVVEEPQKEKEEEKFASLKKASNMNETQEKISNVWNSMMKFIKKKEENPKQKEKISMEFLQNLSKNLKGLSEFFSNQENQLFFLNFLKETPKADLSNAANFDIIFMIFCSEAKKTQDYSNILNLLEITKGMFQIEKFSVYQDHDLWVNHVNIALESKNLNETQTINFRKNSPFNEILHEIFKHMMSVGFKSGFLMEILKYMENHYIFDSIILAEFREILKENLNNYVPLKK